MANIDIFGTLVRQQADEKIVNGSQVEGGFFVSNSTPSWGTTGQLMYNTGNSKFYQYNGSTWAEASFGAAFPSETTANKILISTTTSGAVAWSSATTWSGSAGFLKANDSGVISVGSAVTSVATSGTGLSGGTITATGTITLDSSSAGNAAANKVVLRNAAGSIQTEKVAISSGTNTKATIQYDSTDDAIKFIFS